MSAMYAARGCTYEIKHEYAAFIRISNKKTRKSDPTKQQTLAISDLRVSQNHSKKFSVRVFRVQYSQNTQDK